MDKLSCKAPDRDRQQTEHFVNAIINPKKPNVVLKGRLCDACGVPLQVDAWYCRICNICFCLKCGADLSQIQKNQFPTCPMCDRKLDSGKTLKIIQDKQKFSNYITSTKAEFQNEEDLIRKCSRLFSQDVVYARQIWAMVKKDLPLLRRQTENKFIDKQAESFRPLDRGIIEYTPKTHIHHIPHIIKAEDVTEKKIVNIKDAKPIDGLEVEWKQGKLKPVNPKTYRGSFQDKD